MNNSNKLSLNLNLFASLNGQNLSISIKNIKSPDKESQFIKKDNIIDSSLNTEIFFIKRLVKFLYSSLQTDSGVAQSNEIDQQTLGPSETRDYRINELYIQNSNIIFRALSSVAFILVIIALILVTALVFFIIGRRTSRKKVKARIITISSDEEDDEEVSSFIQPESRRFNLENLKNKNESEPQQDDSEPNEVESDSSTNFCNKLNNQRRGTRYLRLENDTV